jgi:hypothetical protein
MKALSLTLAIGCFVLALTAGLVSVDDASSAPISPGRLDRGFMTDQLLEEDLEKGAEPIKERNNEEKFEEAERNRPQERDSR